MHAPCSTGLVPVCATTAATAASSAPQEAAQERVRAEPFDAVELDLSALWLAQDEP